MAFTKRDVKDRVVQYPRRYQLVEVQSGIFDLIPVTGTVTEPGTAINKAYLQAIEDILDGLVNTGADSVKNANNADAAVDAGKLGGNLPSYFLNNANLSSKQIANSDNAVTTGMFYSPTTDPKKPAGASDGSLFVMAYSSVWVNQIYMDWRTSKIYVRSCNNGTWTVWADITVPLNHASSGSTYGLGDASNYGHVKTRNDLVGTETSGAALTPAMGKSLNDKINSDYTIEIITTSKSWIVPANVRSVDVFIANGGQGGEGGGAGKGILQDGQANDGRARGGSGGNAGYFCTILGYKVTPGQNISVTIGGGGNGGTGAVYTSTSRGDTVGNNGGGGGASYFDGITPSISGSYMFLGKGGFGDYWGDTKPGEENDIAQNGIQLGNLCILNKVKYGGGGGAGGGHVGATTSLGANGFAYGGKGGNGKSGSVGNLTGNAGVNATYAGGGGGGGGAATPTGSGTVTGGKGGNGGSGVCIIRYKEGV